ncbi:toprim domain-containing protein [Paenibacillus filicis]|uniref:Toprim domain-containing protein n=1 Tax=Paenibacillus gyeongsangnamensis TaxID=3388067 RepID=A0ABT4Q994_9BACL|nr:toprim domain-containing protein [Paenibacillus filicis]MCZ8513388.1 toprim domain-containing protein [Paenibacillus filicis]
MNYIEIKRKIYEDGKIKQLLELLGCHNVRVRGKNVVAALPDGDNTSSVQVSNDERLLLNVQTRNISGDIYNLIAYLKYGAITKQEAKKVIGACVYIVRKHLFNDDAWFDNVSMSHQIITLTKQKQEIELKPNKVLDERILNQYVMYPHIDFIKEGIDYNTQQLFEIGFDIQTERITIPIRNCYGELVGVKGRIAKDAEQNSVSKYTFLYPCNKSIELFGLDKAINHIHEMNHVIVFESEKSVMLAHQWNYRNAVATMGKDISDAQIEMLKCLLNDEIEIVIAFDKDTQNKESAINLMKRFDYNNISFIYDVDKIQSEHASPVDNGKEYWDRIYFQRFSRYPEKIKKHEHQF